MKKIIIAVLILLLLTVAGLFAADLFLFTVPEWAIYVPSVIMAALTVLLIIKTRGKAPKVTAVILTVVTAAMSFCGIYFDPYYNSLSLRVTGAEPTLPYDTVIPADKACEDLAYVMHYYRKLHPVRLLERGHDAPVEKLAGEAAADIVDAGSVTVNELAGYIEWALSELGDAHTCAFTKYAEPLYLKHYYKWAKDGWDIAAVNGLTIKDLLEQSRALFSFEAESWELSQMKNMLVSVQGLDYLGFDVSGGVTYTFVSAEGEERTETYPAGDFVTYAEYIAYNGSDSTKSSRGTSFVRFTIDEDRSLALLTLDECIYNSEYVNCLRDMFTQVRDKGIKNVAVDLRDNGGGNDRTATEFIRYLDTDGYRYASETMRFGSFMTARSADKVVNERYPDLTFRGSLYILTSASSFSSAMLFPQYIKDNGLGTLIGEPPGNDPNGYGETATFRTPNSGVWFTISTKRFYRTDSECTDKYVMPDVECNAKEAVDVLYDIIEK